MEDTKAIGTPEIREKAMEMMLQMVAAFPAIIDVRGGTDSAVKLLVAGANRITAFLIAENMN